MSINETQRELSPIRKALVDGFRNSDRPEKVKHWAEVLIATIDGIHKEGENEHNKAAFQANYAALLRAAEGAPFPEMLSPAEIAKAFGLHPRRDQ